MNTKTTTQSEYKPKTIWVQGIAKERKKSLTSSKRGNIGPDIIRILTTSKSATLNDFIVMTGYNKNSLKSMLRTLILTKKITVTDRLPTDPAQVYRYMLVTTPVEPTIR